MEVMESKLTEQKTRLFQQYKTELNEELNHVLSYWMKHVTDHEQGGYYGSVNNENLPDKEAAKGIVMISRICWSFSAAFQHTKKPEHFVAAERAFRYIFDHFIDREHGGVVWSVDPSGQILDGRKQVYGLAFCIYGLTEFYKISNNKAALNTAIDLYHYIEKHSFDKEKNGYVEAFARDWQKVDDLRLSEKDDNEQKTANTHLHIIEAYANLYSVWPEIDLKESIRNLLWLFDTYFISKEHYHLQLFFDDDWNLKSTLQSFGHDIEAAWLLQQCAEVIQNKNYIRHFGEMSVPLTEAALEGLAVDGGLWYEYEPANKYMVYEKHSWPQAEAMIGFYNAYQQSGNTAYLQQSIQSWEFVKKYLRDKQEGEWFWGVTHDYTLMRKDKAGFWKCPYHSTRAFLELINRINKDI